MAFLPVVSRRVAELPKGKSIVEPWLGPMAGTLEMKLANQAAVVSGIGDEFTDKGRATIERGIAVSRVMRTARIQTRHETGATWCADGTLTVNMSEGGAAFDERVNRRSAHMRIAQGADGVEALLVGAVPQDVRLTGHV